MLYHADQFSKLCKRIFSELHSDEALYLSLVAENSQFIRFSQAKVRQSGTVMDAQLEFTFLKKKGPIEFSKAMYLVSLTGQFNEDCAITHRVLKDLRAEAEQLPCDPFANWPEALASGNAPLLESCQIQRTHLHAETALERILTPQAQRLDIAGIYAAGPMVRAMAHSEGLFTWFEVENFSFDFSAYTPSQRAVKSMIAGQQWNPHLYEAELTQISQKLVALQQPSKIIAPGNYRTYMEGAAVADLIHMFNWGGLSEFAMRQGESPMRKIRDGERKFSKLFNLTEDFRSGDVPRFNDLGQLAPESLPLIENGELKNLLISPRTAKEYNLISNGASAGESPRSLCMSGTSANEGGLTEATVLKKLDKGLYLSNLHYLNWSDRMTARVTGMTRYACFWVENGELKAPIENLRWDDSLHSLFGENLEALTEKVEMHPDTTTYEYRHLGATRTPGALFKHMQFTL